MPVMAKGVKASGGFPLAKVAGTAVGLGLLALLFGRRKRQK
jgi:hypothetical protein